MPAGSSELQFLTASDRESNLNRVAANQITKTRQASSVSDAVRQASAHKVPPAGPLKLREIGTRPGIAGLPA